MKNLLLLLLLSVSAFSQSVMIAPQNTVATSDYVGSLFDISNVNTSNSNGITGSTFSLSSGTGVRGIANARFPTGNTYGLKGENISNNSLGYGVFGTHAGGGIGVYGECLYNIGVSGFSSTYGGAGVYGESVNGIGVRGEIKTISPINLTIATAGFNFSTNSIGYGVYGSHAGTGIGIYGTSKGKGVYGEATNTEPTSSTYGVYASNASLNSFGYAVYGSHAGSGIGLYGESVNGMGVRGVINTTSPTGFTIATAGFNFSTNSTGYAVYGFALSGVGGFFSAGSNGKALITENGKVGFGTISPTKSFMVVDGKVGASHAIFGENTSGVSIESDFPGISFNGYYNAGRKAIVNGFVGGMAMNPNDGTIVIYSTSTTGTAGNNTTPFDRITILNNGNTSIAGTVTASCGLLVCSDFRFKKNIRPLNNSLANILNINGVAYNFKQNEFPERNFSDKNQIGFIAQEIEKIYPEMVFTDEKGYKSVDYAKITPALVEAIKEQQKQIEALKIKVAEIDKLKLEWANFKNALSKSETSVSEK
jgi:Chaperone of endosialidase